MLCATTEINELLTTFCYVILRILPCENIFIIIVFYDTTARCPKFRTVKKIKLLAVEFRKKMI